MTPEVVSIFLVVSAVIAFLSYLSGKERGTSRAKEKEEKNFHHKLMLSESQRRKLYEKIKVLNQRLGRYLYFLVKIPEAVKNINSHLSFDDLLSSTIRLVKELIKTNEVEIYIFNQKTECLKLVAAYGTDRKESIEVKLREGVVGSAAEIKMIFSKEQLRITGKRLDAEKIEIAVPVLFKDELIGVIGIGKIKEQTENERRFLAMIADLTAVAFKNCEYLDIAKDEAIKDALTELYNRRYFFERALETIKKSTTYDSPFSIFIFDIDAFKHYNDTNGHTQGDVLLKELGKLLKERSRSRSIVARYGGEEFIVLLQDINGFIS